jgi:NDP-sugar pyrophosphorylase family protein
MVQSALILCGGKGKRLQALLGNDIPKPMMDVWGRPLLSYHIDLLRKQGVSDVILCTGHLSQVIEDHFGDGSRFGMRLRYTREPRALGTAGALAQVPFELAETFFVLYGDVFVNVDLQRMAEFHLANGGEATLAVHPSEHPYDSDLVDADHEAGRIIGFPGRPKRGEEFVNLTSAALYVMNRSVIPHISTDVASDFVLDVFPARLAAGAELYAYRTDEYIHDMGTLDRYARVKDDVKRMMDERAGSLFGP